MMGCYDVLSRICDGLGIPREYLGLTYGTASEQLTATNRPANGR
ncbi:hypothetical protein ABZ897_43020 [Nonomuraea sp. NPDC046802]